jgi:trk system potassium uptake protein TrkA
MKICIAGTGPFTRSLASELCARGHEVRVIGLNAARLELLEQDLDIMIQKGDATHRSLLQRAELHKMDLFVALMDSEAENLVAAAMAKRMGCGRSFAMVDDPAVSQAPNGIERGLFGIDFVLNASVLASIELVRLIRQLKLKSAVNVADNQLVIGIFGADRINKVTLGALAGKDMGSHGRILGVVRDGTFQALTEVNRFYETDDVVICAHHDWFARMCMRLSDDLSARRVHIVGGGAVGTEVASLLLAEGIKVTIIESDHERCRELADRFSALMVVRGDGTDLRLLAEESIQNAGILVATAHADETNLMALLLAREMGIENTFALTHRPDHAAVYTRLGICGVTGFHDILSSFVECELREGFLSFARALGDSNFQILEFEVRGLNGHAAAGENLVLPQSSFLIGYTRAQGVHLCASAGDEQFYDGDTLVFLAQDSQQKDLEKTFRKWMDQSRG